MFFYPRGGSAEVARALARELPDTGWDVTLLTGSLGLPEQPSHAPTFFAGVHAVCVDYTPDRNQEHRLPFPPSYEDKPGAPDRVFARVGEHEYERLVAGWRQALERAGASQAQLLHLHHLTPLNEAALRAVPELPILGHLHGTELAFLTVLENGLPEHWQHARRWQARMRRWAGACERLLVPPGASDEAARLLAVPSQRLVEAPGGVDLELFRRRPLGRERRLAHWRRWLIEQPLGWDESGRPGSIRYRERDLWPFRDPAAVLVYVGRFTAAKRLPLLLRAHTRALARLERPLPLVLVGGHPGECEGDHPLALARALGSRQVFLAGWHPHNQLPDALNAADLLVLPSAAEAFGLVLVEAMACGLPVIATRSHGPAHIVGDDMGWLVQPDDEAALSDALVAAASDAEERRRRGERAHAHTHSGYGWPRVAAQIADLYDEIATVPHVNRVAAQ